MKKIKLNSFELEKYYNTLFHKDLYKYFEVVETTDGHIVSHWLDDYRLYRYERLITRSSSTLEQEFYFMALASYLFAAQAIIRGKDQEEESDIKGIFNSFSTPLFVGVNHRYYDLGNFLKYASLKEHINFKEGVLAYREALELVVPFITGKLLSHFSTWGGGKYATRFATSRLGEYEQRFMNFLKQGVLPLMEENNCNNGLSGIIFSYRDFLDYYNKKFFKHLERYFKVERSLSACDCILNMPDFSNNRWGDEAPADNPKENFLFAAILLYMIIAEQSILDTAPKAETDFHLCSGWPHLASGPGAGPYLHPLLMLEEARLLTRKSEALMLVESMDVVFPRLHQDFCSLLNGKSMSAVRDKSALDRFLQNFKGHGKAPLKNQAKKYVENQMERVRELIPLWAVSTESSMCGFLSNHNVTIQMSIK